MSTIYTFGKNTNKTPSNFPYKVVNVCEHWPTDKQTFNELVRNIDEPLKFERFNGSFLETNNINNNKWQTSLIDKPMWAINQFNGVLPDYFLPQSFETIVYLSAKHNETITFTNDVDTYSLTTNPTGITVNTTDYKIGEIIKMFGREYRYVGNHCLVVNEPQIWKVEDNTFTILNNPHPLTKFDLIDPINETCFNTIAPYSFQDWSNLGEISIPSNVTTISEFAFAF
jgi:hypothetical protein